MTLEAKIKELSHRYLDDGCTPDVTGYVDQLFHVAGESGNLGCAPDGEKRLRFSVRPPRIELMGLAPRSAEQQTVCIVQHEAARTLLRMMCARLAAICRERTATEISPYGDKSVMEYDLRSHRRWSVSFTNTPDRQEFLIEALHGDFPDPSSSGMRSHSSTVLAHERVADADAGNEVP